MKELNEKALENYLSFQYSPGPETFFKNVYKMPQGHYFKYKDGKMELTRYWIPTFQAEEDKSLEYWVDEIEKTFDDSVEAHKISDVEVGSFLSSGVDSSYVACSAMWTRPSPWALTTAPSTTKSATPRSFRSRSQ